MCIGGGLRDQQNEQQVNRCAVDGVEIYGSVQVQQGADRCLTAFEAAMGNGDAVAKTGGTEFFTGNQSLVHILHLQIRHFAADQVGNLFEGFLFTAARRVHEGTAGGQDGFKSNHGWGVLAASALEKALLLFLMLFKLAVKLISQGIDGCIHVFMLGVGDYFATGNL